MRPVMKKGGGRLRAKQAVRGGVPSTDHFAALNAWDDPNISGPEAQISQGYGGFEALDTMGGTKINNYLNQFAVGGDREKAMNALGYFNQGNPYTPQVAKGVNRAYRGQAKANAQTGAYSAPGIYQHQSAGAGAATPGGAPNMQFGGYTGFTTVDPSGAAKYSTLAPNRTGIPGSANAAGAGAGGAGRLRPRPNTQPHTQIGQMGQGAGQMKPRNPYPGRDSGRPVVGGAGGKPGGFPQKTGGAKKGGGPGGGGGGGAAVARPGAFPAAPPQVPNFLPMTPGYEAAYRGANDQLAAAEGAYAASGSMIPAQVGLEQARLRTDQDVATDRLKEELAGRGVYTPFAAESTARDPRYATNPGGGGVGGALYDRRVATPFGRETQDLGSRAAQAYQDRSLGYGQAQLGFNQDMYEALLGRSRDAFEAMPLTLPIGGYELPAMAGPTFSAPAKGGGKKGGGRNRQRNGGRPKRRR